MNNRAADRIEVALDLLSKGNSPSATVTRVAHGWGGAPCSRRTAQRAVKAAYDQMREDYEHSDCDRRAMTAQVINLLLEGCQMCLHTNQPGSLAACIGQLDRIVGLSQQKN
jgi:hypothetical protein